MNKERYNQIIDELYNDYTQTKIIKNKHLGTETHISPVGHYSKITKEEFINKCMIDLDFSEEWKLKIVERELNLEERCELGYKYVNPFEWDMLMGGGQEGDEGNCNYYNIPTKLITLTYNNETIELYE